MDLEIETVIEKTTIIYLSEKEVVDILEEDGVVGLTYEFEGNKYLNVNGSFDNLYIHFAKKINLNVNTLDCTKCGFNGISVVLRSVEEK